MINELSLNEQIKILKEEKLKVQHEHREKMSEQLYEMDQTLISTTHKIYEFDEELVKRLIPK